MKRFLLAALLTAASSPAASSQSAPQSLTPWAAHGATDDFAIARDTTVAHDGRASVRFIAEDAPTAFSGIAAHLPASPYEGRRVRISAHLRAARLEGRGAAVWANDGASAFSTSADRPVVGTTGWTRVEIAIDIPRGAKFINFGIYSFGKGTLWMESARATVCVQSISCGIPSHTSTPRVR